MLQLRERREDEAKNSIRSLSQVQNWQKAGYEWQKDKLKDRLRQAFGEDWKPELKDSLFENV